MSINNSRISSLQAFIIIVSTIQAVGVLQLPAVLVEEVGTDGWQSLIIGHVLVLASVTIMVKLGSYFPRETLIEYSKSILGKVLGSAISIIAIGFWIIITARIIRVFSDVIIVYLLQETPVWVIILTMMVVSAFAASHDLEVIARVLVILFPLMIGLIFLLSMASLIDFDITNFQPAFSASLLDVTVSGIRHAFTDLQGKEALLLLIPFMVIPQQALMVGVGAIGLSLVLRLVLFIVSVGILGSQTLYVMWPVAMVARLIEVPGGVLERLDPLFIAAWVTIAFSSLVIYYYLAAFSLAKLLNLRSHALACVPMLPLLYFIANFPPNLPARDQWAQLDGYLGGVVGWVIPIILLLVAWVRGMLKPTH